MRTDETDPNILVMAKTPQKAGNWRGWRLDGAGLKRAEMQGASERVECNGKLYDQLYKYWARACKNTWYHIGS